MERGSIFRKKIIKEGDGIFRIVWSAVYECPSCGEFVEVVYREKPTPLDEMIEPFLSCLKCQERMRKDKDFREKVMENKRINIERMIKEVDLRCKRKNKPRKFRR